ncbi:hypothetical protein [Thermococcus sp. JdF3]|nr:hypothetical protein [Thermococcus sp. JdF3]
MAKITPRNLLKGTVRIHAGFALIRINSLGLAYPRRTNANITERLRREG